MNRAILLDTDVLVDYLRGREEAVSYVQAHVEQASIPSIVAAELYAGVHDDEIERLDDFISLFPVIPLTKEIARAAGGYQRAYYKSHGVGLADAVIAATAVSQGANLKTLNLKHYPMLKGLKPPYTKK
jgi:predicted nucleic acid-binding protein